MFHLCDMWSLVTGDKVYFSNPHAPQFLPGSSYSSPGRAYAFENAEVAQYADQWAPFVVPAVSQAELSLSVEMNGCCDWRGP